MSKAFALDLKVARRKSGLSQQDCAHLLDAHRTKISRIEHGSVQPTARDIALLSLIFGKRYETLCPEVFERAANDLQERSVTLPASTGTWLSRFSRTNTLSNLDARTERFLKNGYAGS